jgi:hypothetical protein
MMNECIFSPCRTYRYRLTHVFDVSLPLVAFVMLNPSTADENDLDPTLRRCAGFARSWGYGGIVVGNLFAFRATDPRDMKRAADPVGPDNDAELATIARDAELVICAWGVHGEWLDRDEQTVSILRRERELHAIAFTKDDHPCHPLYLRGTLRPQPYRARWTG